MKRKRNRTTSSSALNSSSKEETLTSYYLPDECWESIFRFIIINDNYIYDDYSCYRINHRCLNLLSLVSKQFLSITDRLRFSITINKKLKYCHIFKRFTNLTSLKHNGRILNVPKLLCEISCFPLKQLTSLNISYQRFPADGLRAFSQKIKTLTSLTCSELYSLDPSDLFLIAECFPLLEQLNLSGPRGYTNHSSYVDGVEALSLALIKLRKVNLSGVPINDQSLFHLFNNCKHLEEFIMDGYLGKITNAGLVSAIRERPTLTSLLFSDMDGNKVFPTSDELLYSIAREGLPLTTLDLNSCNGYSYAGIFGLLSKCQRIQHLNLEGNDYLNDQHVVQLSSFLGDLVSINPSGCRKITYSVLFALVRKCPSLSEIKMEHIRGKIVGNSDSLLEFGVYPQLKYLYLGRNSWLSDEILIMVTSIFPNLQLLDLYYCKNISEGICQVLRKCCKIRHLNLRACWGVKLHEMNFVVPKLEVLKLSNTNVVDETLYVISKNCPGLLQLSLCNCIGVTKKGVKYVLKNCRQLREYGYILPFEIFYEAKKEA